MTMRKWLISGVGRSGTTLVYNLLQAAMERSGEKFGRVYEPYLWGPKVWPRNLGVDREIFATTDCLHPFGIYVHTETEIFGADRTALHDRFIEQIFGGEGHALCKIIRGGGRLRQYLELDPEIKILHVVRNPLDVVNSALKHFCLFGDEFHASDRRRFGDEIRRQYDAPVANILDLTEAEQSLLWWKYMNRAACETARLYPDRVLIVPYECLIHMPDLAMSIMARFFDEPRNSFLEFDMSKPAGPVTSERFLRADDIEKLLPECDAYFRDWTAPGASPIGPLPESAEKALYKKYEDVRPGVFVRAIKADTSPLHSLHALRRVRSCLEIDANRQESLNTDYLARRVESIAAKSADNLQHLNEFLASCVKVAIDKNRTRIRATNHLDGLENSRILKTLGPAGAKIKSQIGAVRSQIGMLYDEAPLTCIVTSYNNGDHLRGAVESVFAQSRPPKQILIADDCSTDGSRELIKSLEAEFHNVKAIMREENVGVGMNRHLAILQADTPFITQLDGDDRIFPGKFEAELKVLNACPYTVAYSDFVIAAPGGFMPKMTDIFSEAKIMAERVEAILSRKTSFPRDMIFSKNLYVETGGYDVSAALYEDWSFKLRLAKHARAWKRAACFGTIYNTLHGGLSSSLAERHLYWRLYVIATNLEWLLDVLQPADIYSAIIKQSMFLLRRDLKQSFIRAIDGLPKNDEGLAILARSLSQLASKKGLALSISAINQIMEEFIDDLRTYRKSAAEFETFAPLAASI